MIRCLKNSFGELDKSMPIGPIDWPYFDLIFVHYGKIQMRMMDAEQVYMGSGEAILIYPDTPAMGHLISPKAKISVHHFSLETNDALGSVLGAMVDKTFGYEIYHQWDRSLIEQDIEQVVNLAYAAESPCDEDIRSILMMLIIARLRGATARKGSESGQSSEFESLLAWMGQNLARNVTLDDMAEEAGLSTSHFRAVFKDRMGTSPGNYFLNMRINRAAQLLRETLTPIKKVAQLTGYRDITHFYHSFKAHHGVTPKHYRQEYMPLG